MPQPLPAYVGSDSYIFVSYAHADQHLVFAEIRWLQDHGANVWYDTTGIGPGGEWNDEIARAIKGADHFLYLVTPNSIASEHCRRELNFAQSENRHVIAVHLKETHMPDGMRLSLDNRQAILKYRLSSNDYRSALLGSLTLMSDATAGEQAGITSSKWRYLAAGVLAVLLGWSGWWLQRNGAPAPSSAERGPPSIAVVPFLNMSGDADQQYLSDGIAEEILGLLARNPQLKVISRSSAFSFRDRDLEIPEIADQLNVEHVLEGSVRRSGDRVRIAAHLIEARTDHYVWSETFDRTLEDVFALQREIAKRVAEHLNVALLDLEPAKYSMRSEAYSFYSQARYILGLYGTSDETRRAKDLLDKALEVDPTYVPAWNELSRAYIHLTEHGVLSTEEGRRLSDEAIAKALSLDPSDAVANAWHGWTTSLRDGDFERGVPFLKKGLSLDPTNLDILRPTVPLLHVLGKLEDALALAEYVVERDPLCVICINNLGRTYMMLSRFDDAERVLRRGLSLSPDNIYSLLHLGENQLLQGNNRAALSWFDRLPAEWPTGVAAKAMAFHELDNEEDRDKALRSLDMRQEYGTLALYYAWTDEARNTTEYLRRSISAEARWYRFLWYRFFERRHMWGTEFLQDQRWQELLENIGLSSEQIAELALRVRAPG